MAERKKTRYQIAKSKAGKACRTGSAQDKKLRDEAIERYIEDAIKKGKAPAEAKKIGNGLKSCNRVGAPKKKATAKRKTTAKRK